jgi:hypothetical protein
MVIDGQSGLKMVESGIKSGQNCPIHKAIILADIVNHNFGQKKFLIKMVYLIVESGLFDL